VVAQRAGTAPSGILWSGFIPPLTDYYLQREETGIDLKASLSPGETVVLTHAQETPSAPAIQGGTGKTQLAVEFMHALRNARAAEVLVWVTATSREAILAGFGQAAGTVGAGDPDGSAEAAAASFIAWLAHTETPWALVIDDLADLADLDGLWPTGPAGQVVITTRLPGAAFTAAAVETVAGDVRIAPVGGFSRREALSYLSFRLTDDPDQRIEALDLGEDLDGLPLGLAQAAAVLTTSGLSCREYRTQFNARRKHMAGVPVEGVSAAVLATWSLAAECAHELVPSGLAWPTLALAAMFDPHGIPGVVLTSPAACGYITGRPSTGAPTDQDLARRAITNLARTGLVSIDPANPIRTVRMHPSVQAAVRAYLPPADLEHVMVAAADALIQTWPEPGGRGGQTAAGVQQLEQAMRDCAASLRTAEGGAHALRSAPAAAGGSPQDASAAHGALWQPEAHPLLFRAGRSLEDGGLAESAIAYWQSAVAACARRLGPAHASTVAAKDRLAVAYESAGRFGDAIAAFQNALADRERHFGPAHPDAITARVRLAHAYSGAGRPAEAMALYEQTVSDSSRQLGPGHPVTLDARAGLAEAYQEAGLGRESLTTYQMLTADSERLLGARHPTTLASRDSLAAAFLANGRPKDAIDQYKSLLADHEAMGGRDHPDAIATRASLASAFRRSGKVKDAIAQYRRVLADRERTAGAGHPDTITARANLAFAYRSAGQLREAIPAYERTLEDRERVQGPDHEDTRAARCNLASAYQQAGRLADAIGQYERALADCERMLGPGDLETLTTRSSLASAYYADGRLMQVITVLERALADSERYLGPDHPMTKTVRENLDAAAKT
jgi:tetratricopeptide (TPR) repeat protein